MYEEMLMGYFNIAILFFAINYVDAGLNQLWNRLSGHTNRWFPISSKYTQTELSGLVWCGLCF